MGFHHQIFSLQKFGLSRNLCIVLILLFAKIGNGKLLAIWPSVAFDNNPTTFISTSIKISSVGFKLNLNHFWYNSGYIYVNALTFGAFFYSYYLTPSFQYNCTLLLPLSPTWHSSRSLLGLHSIGACHPFRWCTPLIRSIALKPMPFTYIERHSLFISSA